MTKNLILYTCLALLLSACKKDHNSNSSNPGTWTFKGITYTAAVVNYSIGMGRGYLEADPPGNGYTQYLAFFFPTPLTSSGQMLIMNNSVINSVDVGVVILGLPNTFYECTKTNVYANVTYSSPNKVSIGFAGSIWLHNQGNYSDSAELSISTISTTLP
jgi:hypothetical protein